MAQLPPVRIRAFGGINARRGPHLLTPEGQNGATETVETHNIDPSKHPLLEARPAWRFIFQPVIADTTWPRKKV